MAILVVLKTQDSEQPPANLIAQISEHQDEATIGILLDLSRLEENKAAGIGYVLNDGSVVGRIPVRVIWEKE